MKDLTYPGIRAALAEEFKAVPAFADLNYKASGVSALLDCLAKATHKMSYLAKAVMDEAFVDTAHTMAALTSHAKQRGIVLRGVLPARTVLELRVVQTEHDLEELVVRPGQTFTSRQGDPRVFMTTVPHVLNRTAPGVYTGSVHAVEGEAEEKVYKPAPESIDRVYTVPDPQCWAESVVVTAGGVVMSPRHTGGTGYTQAMNADGLQTITIAGPATREVRLAWVTTRGAAGNGCRDYRPVARTPVGIRDAAAYTIVVTSAETSEGGMDALSVDEARRIVLAEYKQQRRILTPSDLHDFLVSRGDWQGVQVWGGETASPRVYGAFMACVVPRENRVLSLATRKALKAEAEARGVPGDSIVFVDAKPVGMRLVVTVETRDTTGKTVEAVRLALMRYWGTAQSRLDVSTYDMESVARQAGAQGIGVTTVFTVNSEHADSLDFGAEVVTTVKTGSAVVTKTGLAWTAPISAEVRPVVSSYRAPRQFFFTLESLEVRSA